MTDLRAVIAEYLSVRRSLGYKLKWDGLLLAEFADFCEREGAATVTTNVALAWPNALAILETVRAELSRTRFLPWVPVVPGVADRRLAAFVHRPAHRGGQQQLSSAAPPVSRLR